MRNILIAINVPWWNAEAAYAVNLAIGLKNTGLTVYMIVNPDSPVRYKAEQVGISVVTDIYLDATSPLTHYKNYRKLSRFIDEKNIDIINSFKSAGSFIFTLLRKKRSNLRYIKTRGDARQPSNNFLNRYLYGTSGCDGIITVGKKVYHWVRQITPPSQNIRTIYYGADHLTAPYSDDYPESLAALGIPRSASLLTLVGRTQSVKGHIVLMQALKNIKTKDVYLLFLIKDLDEVPEELAEIKAFIASNNLEKQIKILGFQKDLGSILSNVSIGIIPSLASEVNCRVAVEYFSLAVPVLAFPTGTLPDIIQHKENGYIPPDKTPDNLAKGIDWMLEDKNRLRQIGVEGQKRYMSKFTIEKMTHDTIAFYSECMSI